MLEETANVCFAPDGELAKIVNSIEVSVSTKLKKKDVRRNAKYIFFTRKFNPVNYKKNKNSNYIFSASLYASKTCGGLALVTQRFPFQHTQQLRCCGQPLSHKGFILFQDFFASSVAADFKWIGK